MLSYTICAGQYEILPLRFISAVFVFQAAKSYAFVTYGVIKCACKFKIAERSVSHYEIK